MKTFMRLVFKLLYHQFAFAYDLVSATVSVGRWKDWVSSILPFIEGTRILELGSGPGHLQRLLLRRNLIAVAIDESAPMTRLAKRNTNQRADITRGLAQHLPFADSAFDVVVATFPAEYITDQQTLLEVRRCLSDGGRFVVLPVAMQMGRKPLERVMSLLFRITRQTPVDPVEEVKERLRKPFEESGFDVEIQELQVQSSLLLVVIARK